MPKKESKVKEWLEEVQAFCPSCGKPSEKVMVEVGDRPPAKVCLSCKEKAEKAAYGDTPEDWKQIGNEIHLCGTPRELSRLEIAELVRTGAISPLVPDGAIVCVLCPAFGIFGFRFSGGQQ